LTGLASKSSARNPYCLGSLGWLNRRFILECEPQCYDPSCEPIEGPFQLSTTLEHQRTNVTDWFLNLHVARE
jgi:hypothetical protein